MDTIKENMFFVGMGVVVVLALALFFVFVVPLKAQNVDRMEQVDALKNQLERKVQNPDKEIPSDQLEPYLKGYHDYYDAQKTEILTNIEGKKLLDQNGDAKVLVSRVYGDPDLFLRSYQDSVTALKQQVRDAGIEFKADSWAFWDWGSTVPFVQAQRELAAREFVVTQELVKAIVHPDVRVRVLDRVEVDPDISSRSGSYQAKARQRIEPWFDVYPFVLNVQMDFSRYEMLIRELLKARIPIYVRTVSFTRVPFRPGVFDKTVPPLFVGVKIEGWALDYNKEKPASTMMRPGMGGMPPYAP